jgi:multiple sugar transport system permease protein
MRRPESALTSARTWFLLPAVVWTLGFTLFPLVYSFWLSLQRSRGMGRPLEFGGFANYAKMLGDENAWGALAFTVGYALVTVAIQMILGFALAVLVNREFAGRGLVRTLLMMPLFATPVGLGFLGRILYADSGPINTLARSIIGTDLPWMSDVWMARIAVGMLDIWQWTPFCFLILLAGLQGIPQELYDAARIESRRSWAIFRHVTVPLLRPIIGLALLLRLVEALKIIDIPFALTAGGPGRANETFTIFVYRTAFTGFDIGYASALSFIFLLVAVVIVNLFLIFGRFREMWQTEAGR